MPAAIQAEPRVVRQRDPGGDEEVAERGLVAPTDAAPQFPRGNPAVIPGYGLMRSIASPPNSQPSLARMMAWMTTGTKIGPAIAAPLAAWMAVTGTFEPRMLSFCFAAMFWVAGFDIFYALQDVDFDRAQGIHSIPRRLGVRGALRAARAFHLAMAALLLVGYHDFGLGYWYLAGWTICAVTLVYEHSIVKENDLSRIDLAFFNLNGVVSLVLGLFTWIDLAF